MATAWRYVPQCYRDSVSLMAFSRRWAARPGISRATAQMGTAANLALLVESGVLAEPPPPRPDDLLLVVAGEGELEPLLDEAESELRVPRKAQGQARGPAATAPASVLEAVKADPALDLALISVPGDYAAGEALKALASGLDVMLFSDNVSVEQEVRLKQEATRRGRLLLGPDCGTAILNGTPLGFANQLRRGPVGVVSASGTGLQEVTSLLDRWGLGISQAYGTGGRDLMEAVGGLTALACIDRLAADPETACLLLVAKRVGPRVREKLTERLRTLRIPAITCFLGDGITLEAAAFEAFRKVRGRDPEEAPLPAPRAIPGRRHRTAGFLRGLYAGGTLCVEAAWLCARSGVEVFSNVQAEGVRPVDDVWLSRGHCFIDLGEDQFTRGRPHPMIDPTLRLARLAEEAARRDTFRILADVVLGHGAHPDPAGVLAQAVLALPLDEEGRCPEVWACVIGTEADPQGWSTSMRTLAMAGIRCFGSNAAMVAEALRTLP